MDKVREPQYLPAEVIYTVKKAYVKRFTLEGQVWCLKTLDLLAFQKLYPNAQKS